MTAHSATQTVLMARGTPPCKPLAIWLSKNCPGWRYGSEDYGIDHARNQNVRRFLREDVPQGKTHLLMIDADMVPVASTMAILHEPGDLLFCGHVGQHGSRGHLGNDDFGAACFRASAELLAKMPDPWFKMVYQDGCRTICECRWFQRLAFQAGVNSKQVGVIGHQQTCILLPADNELGWGLAWPHDLDKDR